MKRISKAIFEIAIPLLLCGVLGWLPVHVNNLRLKHFAENLYQYPLPLETTVLSQRAELSKLGNGNNCSYKVHQSMFSTLPREAIEQYYDGAMFPRVSFGRWDKEYERSTKTPIRLKFDELQSTETETYFTLTLFDAGLDVTLDVRCH